jgi:putative ABC transport system permease protein
MYRWQRWLRRIRVLMRRAEIEQVMDRELQYHIDCETAEHVRRGMSPEGARRRALREFGGIERIKEEVRDARGSRSLEDAARDFRFAARALGRAPGFTVVAVSSLALGLAIAASTLVVVNAYLVRSLPYPAANRLYAVRYNAAVNGAREPTGMSAIDWTSLSDVVEYSATSVGETFHLADRGSAETARGLRVSEGFIQSLGMQPVIGRSFQPEEFREGAERVVLISHAFWRSRFAADPTIVGRQLRTYTQSEGRSVETSLRVVGVLAPLFWYQHNREGPDVVVPLRVPARTYMVRLREDVPVADAERRMTDAARRVGSAFPDDWPGVQLASVHERYVAGLHPVLVGITIHAALVLVIVCANVAVLMLLRNVRRQKEMGIRLALGAGRRHIVRMLTTETCLLCGAALAVGLALTGITLKVLAPFIERYFERPAPGGLSVAALDPTVLFAIGGVGVLVAASLAFIPLLPAGQRRLGDALRREGRSSTDGPAMRRLQSTLIAFEVSGSLALLVGCGLMVRSIVNLVRTDIEFQMTNIAYVHLVLPATYDSPGALAGFYDPLVERLSASSQSPIALADHLPFSEPRSQSVQTDDGVGANDQAGVRAVNPAYFATHQSDIVQGRTFTESDRLGAEPVAMVSETLARRLWPNGNPLGRRLRAGQAPSETSLSTPWRTVIGVLRDARQTYADSDLRDVYVPFSQAPSRFTSVYQRTDHPFSTWFPAVRAAVADINPFVTINDSGPLASKDQQMAGTKFLTSVLTWSAGFTAFLALLGIYGITAYAVQQRQREVAIRLALGATGDSIMRMFLKEGGIVLAAGLAGGLLGAVVMARMLERQIHGVKSLDLSTFAAMCVLMALTGLLATWWPATRAATRSPSGLLNES